MDEFPKLSPGGSPPPGICCRLGSPAKVNSARIGITSLVGVAGLRGAVPDASFGPLAIIAHRNADPSRAELYDAGTATTANQPSAGRFANVLACTPISEGDYAVIIAVVMFVVNGHCALLILSRANFARAKFRKQTSFIFRNLIQDFRKCFACCSRLSSVSSHCFGLPR